MKTVINVLSVFLTAGITVGAAQNTRVSTGLKTPLKHFAVSKKTFADSLRELAGQQLQNVVLGFEHVVEPPGSEVPLLDVAVDDGTVEDALAAMCLNRRYTYSEVQPGVVEVRPAEEPPELASLLNLQVPALDLELHEWPFNLFARATQLIPQLSAYLTDKVMDWSRRTGNLPPGSAGWAMDTGAPPLIKIHLRDTTVRGVLNAFAAYSQQHAPRDRSVQPFYSPMGWRVDFTSDPTAPTGLGGYVRWSPFPFP